MPNRHPRLLIAALFLALAAAAQAQPATDAAPAETAAPEPAVPAIPEPPPNGFRADYLKELARFEARMLALAGEIPAERWGEPPGPEIHPLGECLADLAAASRGVLVALERPAPDALDDRQAAADKARTVEHLSAVLAAVRRAVEETPDDGLEAPIDYLGRRWTVRALFLLLLGQNHEGLGHAAALAEVLGVPPPWVKHRRTSEASGDD